MFEKHYYEVRRLLREAHMDEAEKISKELTVSKSEFSTEEKYWQILISSEIKRHKKEFISSMNDLEEAFQLSKEIELTNTQKSSLHGRMAILQFAMKNYSSSIHSCKKALSLLSKDLARKNYYYRMMLHSYFNLNDENSFSETLQKGLNNIFQGQVQKYWNSILDFIWDFCFLAKEESYYELVNRTLDIFENQQLGILAKGLLEYSRARLARLNFNRKRFLNHLQKSLKYCKGANPDNYVSLSLNYVWMLQLFGDYHRAKNILLYCLRIVQDQSKKVYVLNSLGSNLRFNGEYDLAIQYLNESLKINNEYVHNIWQASYSNNTLGMVYTLIGHNKKAKEHYKSSLKLSEDSNDYYGQGFTYGALGWLESNQGNLKQAEEWYKSSVTLFEEKTNGVPSIILLAYAELLSRTGKNNRIRIEELTNKARDQIWEHQKHLDIGRYYNTLGNIALNQKQIENAQKEFSLALEYSESFEVEVQTLLGMIKTYLEAFMVSDSLDDLKKAELFLDDLKSAAESSSLILGEVELILGIIDMYKHHYSKAIQRFDSVIELAENFKFSLLVDKANYQKKTLQILQTHDQLQEVTTLEENYELTKSSIREAIEYLTGLSKLVGTHTEKDDKDLKQ